MEWSVHHPASYLVVPISVAAQGTHRGAYVVSHIVGYDAPQLLQANRVPLLPEGPFLRTKCLGEIVPDFRMFSISCHI